MSAYQKLAQELMEVLDRGGPVPPQDKVSKAMRGEMAVLRLLEREGKRMTAGDISQKLGMKTPRIAAVLNSLEKKGMIARYADEEDRRRVMVALTGEGKTFCLRRKEEATAHMMKILSYLGERDAPEFVRLMKRLHEILPLIGPPGPLGGGNQKDDRSEKQFNQEETDE